MTLEERLGLSVSASSIMRISPKPPAVVFHVGPRATSTAVAFGPATTSWKKKCKWVFLFGPKSKPFSLETATQREKEADCEGKKVRTLGSHGDSLCEAKQMKEAKIPSFVRLRSLYVEPV